MKHRLGWMIGAAILFGGFSALGAPKVVVDHADSASAAAGFKFEHVPAPAKDDAATSAKFTIVDGQRDPNGGELSVLHDGSTPTEADEPSANFFFAQNADGGRLQIDLGKAAEVKQVNTYSWHPGTRGPQVYKLYASDGSGADFKASPSRDTDPEKCGWKLLASVDTRAKAGDADGGQYGVSVSDPDGMLGKFRYLLLDARQTESKDPFGNTFFSEIDVVAPGAATVAAADDAREPLVFHTKDGKYTITIDVSQAPELKQWVQTKLAPVMLEWYPKIVDMLPSDNYTAPSRMTVVFQKSGSGVAATGGTRITCWVPWFKNNLRGEAVGAVVHEMVHVAQQYGRARRFNRQATRPPGWLVEGIPDYIRWFIYEPQSHGADRVRNPASARYDGSYRISANFLNFVSEKYDKEIVKKLNAAMRDGKYTPDIWKENTGKTVEQLADEWKKDLEKKAGR